MVSEPQGGSSKTCTYVTAGPASTAATTARVPTMARVTSLHAGRAATPCREVYHDTFVDKSVGAGGNINAPGKLAIIIG